MPYKSLQQFIDTLEAEGELLRIKEFVDPVLQITEIADRFIKNNGPALLFENTGTDFPLLINALGSEKRMAMALGVQHLDDIAKDISALFANLTAPKNGLLEKIQMLPQLGKVASWMPKKVNKRGTCQELIHRDPDLSMLPVMQCWPADGGRFITLPVIHTLDPENGARNVGMYRMQVFDKQMTGMHWHKHKVSAGHFNKYKAMHKRMPVSVALGGDPVYTYCATAPLPPNVDEYLLAGFIRKKHVELVKCITNDMYVPADADIIIEGYVDPDDDLILEGPFGDHTGYYSLADMYPRFHVTCITHKKNAVYPSTIVGIPPQEDAWIGKATERIFLAPIKLTMLPEVEDMDMPIEGVFHNLTIVQIKKEYAGHAQKVMNAMWGAGQMMFNKILIIADEHADIHDYNSLIQHMQKNVDPQRDIYFSAGPMDVLDHSCSAFAFGGKMCIDATTKTEEELQGRVTYAVPHAVPVDALKTLFPEIREIDTQFLRQGIGVISVAVEKTKAGQIRDLHRALSAQISLQGVKGIFYTDHTVEISSPDTVIWNIANNIDARRDVFIEHGMCGMDGTRKTKALDNFDRPWPNVIVMDDKTIAAIDAQWNALGLGTFYPSPSLKYKRQVIGEGAVAIE
ncbi:MAG: menaquinone biosynthesis decarboxylase [Chitinophagales bacterium]